jgi:hypothetical protein
MKRVLTLAVVFLFAADAMADTCSKKLMPAFTSAQAIAICGTFGDAIGNALIPQTDDTYDLGTASLEWQDAFFDGTVRADAITADGDISFSTSGSTVAIQEATAGAACSGTATANGTTAVTISTTCATTGSRIFISATGDGTGAAANDQGACWATNISNGVSFDLDCPDANNNAAYNWIIFHESGAS